MNDFNLKIRRMIYLGIGVLIMMAAMGLSGNGFHAVNKINNAPQVIESTSVNSFQEVTYYEE